MAIDPKKLMEQRAYWNSPVEPKPASENVNPQRLRIISSTKKCIWCKEPVSKANVHGVCMVCQDRYPGDFLKFKEKKK